MLLGNHLLNDITKNFDLFKKSSSINSNWSDERMSKTMSIRTSLKKVLPPISITEQEALEAGDVWLESSIYQGKPDMQALRNIPAAKLSAEELAF